MITNVKDLRAKPQHAQTLQHNEAHEGHLKVSVGTPEVTSMTTAPINVKVRGRK